MGMTGISEQALAIIEQAKLKAIARTNPLLSDVPDWVSEYRSHQVRAVKEVVGEFERGAKVVVLEAPTGAGKTLIAESVRRMLAMDAVYVCSSKSLQDQFLHDFPYARVIKGRGNYPTKNFPFRFKPGEMESLSCEDCTANRGNPECKWCGYKSECPYEIAKKAAIKANVAVLNTAYYLIEVNNIGKFRSHKTDEGSRGRLVIADEADTLESMLMGHVSVEISESRMKRWGWEPPKKVTVKESWREWLDETLPLVTAMWLDLPAESEDPKILRESRYLSSLAEKLKVVSDGLDSGAWVYTGRDGAVSFKPSRVDTMGEEYLWKWGTRFLLMSATVISAQEMLDSLGYKGDWSFVGVGSTFRKENRRVIVRPVVNMARDNVKRGSEAIDAVKRIVLAHPSDRVLVHTVSYDLTKQVADGLRADGEIRGRKVLSYTRASEREPTLARFLRSEGAILLAPSMDRGIDLPGDACRVQVIIKCPFPFLGDRQVSARLHSKGGQTWYTVQTIRTIVQMTGRAVRSESDWAVTYVVDKEFSRLYTRFKQLFPSWWKEAVEWERVR